MLWILHILLLKPFFLRYRGKLLQFPVFSSWVTFNCTSTLKFLWVSQIPWSFSLQNSFPYYTSWVACLIFLHTETKKYVSFFFFSVTINKSLTQLHLQFHAKHCNRNNTPLNKITRFINAFGDSIHKFFQKTLHTQKKLHYINHLILHLHLNHSQSLKVFL